MPDRSQRSRVKRAISPQPRSLACAVRATTALHLDIVMGFKTILVPIEQHDLANSTLQTALLLARKFDSYIEGAPARSCIALSLSIRSQPVAGTRIARQSDQGVSDALTQISYR